MYVDTLGFYEALFGTKPPKEIWEPVDERFSPDMFDCSVVNVQRLANYYYCLSKLEGGQYVYQNNFKRRNLEDFLNGKVPVYDRKFTTERRKKFILNRRKLRRDALLEFKKKESVNYELKDCDCLAIEGGPLIVPTPYDYKFYLGNDFLDRLELGFYQDYDPYDNHEIILSYK